jgi:hypothetical protein
VRRWLDFGTTGYAKPHWMKDEPKIPTKRSRSQRAMIHYQEGKVGSPGLYAMGGVHSLI